MAVAFAGGVRQTLYLFPFQQVNQGTVFLSQGTHSGCELFCCSGKTVVVVASAGGVRRTLYLLPFSASGPNHSFSLTGHP